MAFALSNESVVDSEHSQKKNCQDFGKVGKGFVRMSKDTHHKYLLSVTKFHRYNHIKCRLWRKILELHIGATETKSKQRNVVQSQKHALECCLVWCSCGWCVVLTTIFWPPVGLVVLKGRSVCPLIANEAMKSIELSEYMRMPVCEHQGINE